MFFVKISGGMKDAIENKSGNGIPLYPLFTLTTMYIIYMYKYRYVILFMLSVPIHFYFLWRWFPSRKHFITYLFHLYNLHIDNNKLIINVCSGFKIGLQSIRSWNELWYKRTKFKMHGRSEKSSIFVSINFFLNLQFIFSMNLNLILVVHYLMLLKKNQQYLIVLTIIIINVGIIKIMHFPHNFTNF